jgi:glucose-6-phosphate 1-dehydrogenase
VGARSNGVNLPNHFVYHARVRPNPLREGLRAERLPEPASMVIFGASGDLTRRKLLPALYSLLAQGLLPPGLSVTGFARREISDDTFREQMRAACAGARPDGSLDPRLWSSFASGLSYVAGEFGDPAAYERLARRLAELDRARSIPGNRIFYLATPPDAFPVILERLGASGLLARGRRQPFARVIVEKPFGTDLESAQQLNRQAGQVASEEQIYRIDHYLGKETVQNLLVFRFDNAIFEPLWNNKYIDHVQVTGAEAIGIEGRGGYFDHAGILRDMVQNHLLQTVSLVAMEPPIAWSADEIRDEKLKVLKALRPPPADAIDSMAVRGQYDAGSVLGKFVPGYRDEPGVAKDSQTETFVALKFYIDNWRWAGVPFYLRSGKALPKRVTEIALTFRSPPHRLLAQADPSVDSNVLAIRIQPDEGIALKFGSKVPGPEMEVQPVNMEFRYGTSFGAPPPEAYERLLLDCMLGDATLFLRGDEVEASWRWVSRIHQAWAKARPPARYAAGTWGPEAADALIEQDGREWRKP